MSAGYTRFDGMTWPNPDGDLEWRLRYGEPSREDLLHAAFILHAYASLIDCNRDKRARVVREIKRSSRAR